MSHQKIKSNPVAGKLGLFLSQREGAGEKEQDGLQLDTYRYLTAGGHDGGDGDHDGGDGDGLHHHEHDNCHGDNPDNPDNCHRNISDCGFKIIFSDECDSEQWVLCQHSRFCADDITGLGCNK